LALSSNFTENETIEDKLNYLKDSLNRMEKSVLKTFNSSDKGGVDVVVGAQWGDEGKGKLVDVLSGEYDMCARVNGGSNAGHTIVANVSMVVNLILKGVYSYHIICEGEKV
jgi:adenylosuccinate synthase